MKFKTLEIENFMAIGHIKARLDNRGLVLITGENLDDSSQDSNGSGKSSLTDALSWVIYGITARNESGDSIINDNAGKNCRVQLEIEADGVEYRIVRHRKYTKKANRLELYADGVDMTDGTDKLTQEKVNRLIGASKEVFMASIYAGQERMPDLPGMTDRELKTIVEEAAGIHQIEQAYKLARERLNELKSSMVLERNNLQQAQARVVELQEDIERLVTGSEAWDQDRDTRLAEVGKQMADQKKLYEAIPEVDSEEVEKLNQALADLQAQIDGAAAERTKLTNLQDLASKAFQVKASKEATLKSALVKVTEYKKKLAETEAGIGQACEECGRAHTHETLGEAISRVKAKLKEFALEAHKVKAEFEAALKASENADKSVSDYKATMTDLSEVIDSQREIERTLSQFALKDQQKEALKVSVQSLAKQYRELRDSKNPSEPAILAAQDRLTQWVEKVESMKSSIKKMEDEDEAVLTEVVNVFGPAGVRAHILDSVTPFLNDRTSHYLAILSDGNISATWTTLGETAKGELRENFHISVESMTGAKSFGLLSGGEKRKVRLACSMALQDLVATSATKPIDLFIADEVDAAIDVSGLERLMTIVHDKASQVGTVLVISHSDLKSWISNAVTVVKSGGKSTLVGTALG